LPVLFFVVRYTDHHVFHVPLMYQRLPLLIFPFLLSALIPTAAAASTLYKCTDDSGVVLYTNQKTEKKNCIVLSVQVPPPPPKSASDAASSRPARAASTPTPSDFPRVSSTEQKARDTDRRAILERELAAEQASLDKAKQVVTSAGAKPPQSARDTVTLHERNVEALNKELAKLR
jgi:hypothetical protein